MIWQNLIILNSTFNFIQRETFIGKAIAGKYDNRDNCQGYKFDEKMVTLYPDNASPGIIEINQIYHLKNVQLYILT